MPNVAAPLLVTAREGKLPPVKFAITMPAGVAAGGGGGPVAAVKVAAKQDGNRIVALIDDSEIGNRVRIQVANGDGYGRLANGNGGIRGLGESDIGISVDGAQQDGDIVGSWI